MAKMQTIQPTQKVTAGMVAGALSTVTIWLLKTYAHANVPGDVGAAITTAFAFIIAYLVPPSIKDQVAGT